MRVVVEFLDWSGEISFDFFWSEFVVNVVVFFCGCFGCWEEYGVLYWEVNWDD